MRIYPPIRPSGKSGLSSMIVSRPRTSSMMIGPAYEQLRKMVQLEIYALKATAGPK